MSYSQKGTYLNQIMFENFKIECQRSQLLYEFWYQNRELTEKQNHPWSVRNDDDRINVYMFSSFPVENGKYYYEVELLDKNGIEVGWTTILAQFFIPSALNKQLCLFEINVSKPGDIIGCLANMENKTTIFYYNGQKIIGPSNTNLFNTKQIFAMAFLKNEQQAIVNFGQKTFKYPPNMPFQTFNSRAFIKKQQFELSKNLNSICTLFCTESFLNFTEVNVFEFFQNSLPSPFLFCDIQQKCFDKLIKQIIKKINNDTSFETIINYVFNRLVQLNEEYTFCRLFQSVLENNPRKIIKNKFQIFDTCLILIFNFKKINFFNACFNFHPIIQHYLNYFKMNKNYDYTKIYYFCFIILNIKNINKQYFYQTHLVLCCKHLDEMLFEFLLKIVVESPDLLSKLYSFILLKRANYNFKKFPLPGLSNSLIKNKQQFFNLFISKIHENNEQEIVKKAIEFSIHLQLYLYLNFYFNELHKPNQNDACVSNKTLFFQMNPDDQGGNVFFSPSNLMVRNDEKDFRTIRSKFSINPGTFYFEVTLITGGPMTIGLAAKQMDIGDKIGQNAFSIGIDGFNRCLVMHKRNYPFTNFSVRWKVGDVIGIYFDSYNREIIFGINENVIQTEKNPFEEEFIFEALPCHVAVSLETFQQCYFNFNCAVIPQVFCKNNLNQLGQNVNIHSSMFLWGSTNTMESFSVTSNPNCQNLPQQIMSPNETAAKLFPKFQSTTLENNKVYGRILSKSNKIDASIILKSCEFWVQQMEMFLPYIDNTVSNFNIYMEKIGKIRTWLKKDQTKSFKMITDKTEPSTEQQSNCDNNKQNVPKTDSFAPLFDSNDFSIVTLCFPAKTDNCTITVHKTILQNKSSFFKTTLNNNKLDTVVINEVPYDAMKAVVRFMYNGKVETGDLKVHCTALCKAAHLYQIESLIQYCKETLCEEVQTANAEWCKEVLIISNEYSFEKLRKCLIEVAQKRAIEKLKTLTDVQSLFEMEEIINSKILH